MIMSDVMFFLFLGAIGIIGTIIALKYADYEKRKRHEKM